MRPIKSRPRSVRRTPRRRQLAGQTAVANRDSPLELRPVPGAEFPACVYVSVLAAFAWIMLASWLAFANGDRRRLWRSGIAVVLAIVFFALPVIVRLTASRHLPLQAAGRAERFSVAPVSKQRPVR